MFVNDYPTVIFSRNGILSGDGYVEAIDMYNELGLVCVNKPRLSPPSLKSSYIDNQYTNGALDLTESLVDYLTYENRTGKLDFYIYDSIDLPKKNNVIGKPDRLYNELNDLQIILDNLFHNKVWYIHLDTDTDFKNFSYKARLEVDTIKQGGLGLSTVTISYNAEPYRKNIGSPEKIELGIGKHNVSITNPYDMPIRPILKFPNTVLSGYVDIGYYDDNNINSRIFDILGESYYEVNTFEKPGVDIDMGVLNLSSGMYRFDKKFNNNYIPGLIVNPFKGDTRLIINATVPIVLEYYYGIF